MGRIGAGLLAVLWGLALAFQPAAAREALAVDPEQSWTHPHSGIEVPFVIGGIERSGADAYADDHLDVGLSFNAEDPLEALSVYIFRKTNGNLPIWFAQAQWGLDSRAALGSVEQLPSLARFDRDLVGGMPGMKAVYRTSGQTEIASTGVAMFEVGEWFVKLRASSAKRSPQELDVWIDRALSELVIPPGAASQANAWDVVVAVVDCSDRLEFKRKARDAPQELGSLLLGGLLGAMIAGGELEEEGEADEPTISSAPVRWCRDHRVQGTEVVYRPDGSTDSYLLAFGDNGNAVRVGPETGIEALLGESTGGKKRYTITLVTAGRNTNYVAQDRLPSPQRVFELIDKDRTTMSVPTWGDDKSINITSDAID